MKPSTKGVLVFVGALVFAGIAAFQYEEAPLAIVSGTAMILGAAYWVVSINKFNGLGDEIERLRSMSWEERLDLIREERELEDKKAKDGLIDEEADRLRRIADRQKQLSDFETQLRSAKSKDALPSYPYSEGG